MKLIIPFLLISFFIGEIAIANGLLEEESDDSTTTTAVKKPSKSGEAMVNKEESEDSDVFYDDYDGYEEAEDQQLVSDVKEDDLSDDANQADEIKTKQSAVKKNEKKMENKKWWQFWK